jgi:hypothetical protein
MLGRKAPYTMQRLAKIRLVTICDSNGKIMYSEHRQGVQNLLSPEESKKSLELAVNSWKTRSQLA